MLGRFRLIRFSLVALLVTATGHSTWAQEPVARAVNFTCVTWDSLPDEEVFFRKGSVYERVQIGFKRRSKIQDLAPGSEFFELFRKVVSADGNVDYQLIGRTANVSGTDRALFFIQLFAESGQPSRLGLFGIDDSLSTFPVGSFRFFNATGENLQVLLNRSKAQVPAQGMTVVQPELPAAGGFMPVYIGDADANVIYESRFFAQPRGRKLVIIRPPEESGRRIRLRFLSEMISSSL